MSTYERELLALVSAVRKWRSYLLGQTFRIRTDQQSLKHLLKQKVGTSLQQKWVTKLLEYDFLMEYKQGRDNKVADAFFRKFEKLQGQEQGELKVISFPIASWLDDLRSTYSTDTYLQDLITKLHDGS